MTEVKLPEELNKYAEFLGEHGVCSTDSCCGEPVTWGWKVVKRLDGDWVEFCKAAEGAGMKVQCLGEGAWSVVSHTLTEEEAIEKYGEVTNVERGPRGGFKSATYGEKKF